MDHAVLFDADVDEGAEVDDVADGTLQFHSWLQVLHRQYILAQQWLRDVVTRVAAWFRQAGDDVLQRFFP